MMEDIDIGVTVELLPGFDEVYRAATAGSRGSIKGIKEDDMGFLLVNIEWDKGHWTYAGQNDGWTFANHFAVVAENELICGSDEDPQAKDQYIEAIMDAFDEASESQGFLLVALKEPDPSAILRRQGPRPFEFRRLFRMIMKLYGAAPHGEESGVENRNFHPLSQPRAFSRDN